MGMLALFQGGREGPSPEILVQIKCENPQKRFDPMKIQLLHSVVIQAYYNNVLVLFQEYECTFA